MRIDVVSIFPEFFAGPFTTSLLGKAAAGGLVDLRVHDLRAWSVGKHRTIDDTPYGGGAGMVMRADVWVEAVREIQGDQRPRTVVLTPRGRPLTQVLAAELAREPWLVVCCGRYEGIDERAHELLATDQISIGDYVLAGGEGAAVVLVDAVTRLVPGVLGNDVSVGDESFVDGLLEYPQYTRPAEVEGRPVPSVLLSGDHGAIARWRRERALERTRDWRPDLYDAWLEGGGEPAQDTDAERPEV
ncbi:MAG: tRNA (guanosine(37)-N1)-methyltransferase TrmD [Actinobacteria bacterium]|nr:tRNA (guanosine(37)-N1)-methyltransferase TrmD [Actinomycetota bacterium]